MTPKIFILALLLFVFSLGCSDEGKLGDRCSLKPEVGNCKGAINRYYFDKASGNCMVFSWGGCDGVVPFETLEECENQCDCKAENLD